jgi:hypothetical protein
MDSVVADSAAGSAAGVMAVGSVVADLVMADSARPTYF